MNGFWERLWRGNYPRKYREFVQKLRDGDILPIFNFAGFTRARERFCVEEIILMELMSLLKLHVGDHLPGFYLREI
ncbi:hypothetical protein A2U01_0054160 [Trifolium medium]|uniref:Uncharacterized protein n=1 Tax=Trifolium medium TaxID=97028 RepID=A0A392RBK2_9FABA|nr:hypothetical protein [Trifolium medium]